MSRRVLRANIAAAETLLSWRRTALQLAVGAIVATRALVGDFGSWLVLGGLLGTGLAFTVHASASRAYDEAREGIERRSGGRGTRLGHPHARLAPVLIGTLAIGVVALVWVWNPE